MREDTADRLQELVTTIERGWETLKRMQEEPIRELREQAASLTQVSAAMANASQQDIERTDARFASFEHDVHLRLNELTLELQSTLAEIRTRLDRQPASQDASTQWSLDDVTRLHGQLRDGVRDARELPHTTDSVGGRLRDAVPRADHRPRPFRRRNRHSGQVGHRCGRWLGHRRLAGRIVRLAAAASDHGG